MKLFNFRNSRTAAPRAFTIIEIALCLGIIGFALVAIIAVLPRGLDVQKRNREETIISHDSEMWMSYIRSGALGSDDLTNYVMCITNFWTTYNATLKITGSGIDYYTPTNSKVTSIAGRSADDMILTNGMRIVGLLSTPTKILLKNDPNWAPFPVDAPYQSNHIVAYVRAFSGSAVDKPPQNNNTILSDAFVYRLIVESFPYAPVDTNGFCMNCAAATPPAGLSAPDLATWWQDRTNLARSVRTLQTNVNDIRLRFRWPVLPNGKVLDNNATFRAVADGMLGSTNDLGDLKKPLYFIQPSVYSNLKDPKDLVFQ